MEAKVRGTRPPQFVGQEEARASGVFVTLRIDQVLRGCVGQVEATDSLVDTVCHVAAAGGHRGSKILAGGDR